MVKAICYPLRETMKAMHQLMESSSISGNPSDTRASSRRELDGRPMAGFGGAGGPMDGPTMPQYQ